MAEPTMHDPACAPVLKRSIVTARSWERYTITDLEGRPAVFAILDGDGQILDSGPAVAQEIWDLAIAAERRYLVGEGYLKVTSSPAGLTQEAAPDA